MEPTQACQIRAQKRLMAAEGYLELGLPTHALECLEGLGALGPLEPIAQMLRGKALWLQRRYTDAARSLRAAAETIHAPHDRPAWLALSLYYRHAGKMAQAIDSLARARGAHPPVQPRSQPG